jgi:alanine racemase
MPRPIRATINLAALRHNYLLARSRAAGAKVWAVVKANAYGHGLQHAVAALADVADGFALLDLAEAIALRDAGVRQPILLLEGIFEAADIAVCAEYGLTPAIHRLEQLPI